MTRPHGELAYCPQCLNEVYPASEPCKNCGFPDRELSIDSKFENLRSYLTSELCGYEYALEEHKRRLELEMGNKVEYIKGRIDAIKAALEVATTFT